MEYDICTVELLLGIFPAPTYDLSLMDKEYDRLELKLSSAEYKYH